jgi:hypothetical protein
MLAYGASHGRALSLPQTQRATSATGLPSHSNTRVLSSDENGPALKKARAAKGDPASWKDSTTSGEKIRQSTAPGIVKARDVFFSMKTISSGVTRSTYVDPPGCLIALLEGSRRTPSRSVTKLEFSIWPQWTIIASTAARSTESALSCEVHLGWL